MLSFLEGNHGMLRCGHLPGASLSEARCRASILREGRGLNLNEAAGRPLALCPPPVSTAENRSSVSELAGASVEL